MTGSSWILLNIFHLTAGFWWLCAIFSPEIQTFWDQPTSTCASSLHFIPPWEPPITARLNSSCQSHAVSVLWLWSSFSGLLKYPVFSDCPSLASPSRPSSNLLLGQSFFKKAATCGLVSCREEYLVWSQTFRVHVHEIPEIKPFILQGPQSPPFIKQELWSWFWWPPNLSEMNKIMIGNVF